MMLTGFTTDKRIYEIKMRPLTFEKLQMYCELYELDIERYFKRGNNGRAKFCIPGTYLLSSLRKEVERLNLTDPGFPIKTLHNMEPSTRTTDPNPIFLGDELTLKIQANGVSNIDPNRLKSVCVVQMYRDEEIVFKGTFDFIERKC